MGSIPITRSNLTFRFEIFSRQIGPLTAMRRLYQARDRIEAQFLRDFLDQHLISTTILGDYLSGAAGELPLDIYPSVWVTEDDDLPRARELLARFLELSKASIGPGWVCPGCGEPVEPGFDLCWNCGRLRD